MPFLSEVRSRPLLLCASGRLPVLHSSVFRYAQENRYTRVPGTCALLSRDTRFTGGTKLDNKRQTAWKGADLKWIDSPSCNCLKYRVHFYASGHECELNERSLPLGHFFFTLSIIEAEHDLPHLGRVNYPWHLKARIWEMLAFRIGQKTNVHRSLETRRKWVSFQYLSIHKENDTFFCFLSITSCTNVYKDHLDWISLSGLKKN